jgi:hypothetical protein
MSTTDRTNDAAERMRLYRKRRRQGLRYIRIPLHVTEIDDLIRLAPEARAASGRDRGECQRIGHRDGLVEEIAASPLAAVVTGRHARVVAVDVIHEPCTQLAPQPAVER